MRAHLFCRTQFLSNGICQGLLLFALVSVIGCQPKNDFIETPPAPVTVANPISKKVVQSLTFTGTTEPINMVDIRARVEGFLESIEFEEGKGVKKDDLLFTIDPRPFEAALAQAEASVRLAQAQVESGKAEENRAIAEVANAKAQLARGESAARSGAVTEAEIDILKTAVLTASASVDAAKASIASAEAEIAAGEALVTQAKLDIEYTQVRSPINGRVGRRSVDIGNLVGAGESTLLTTVVQYDPVYAVFTINENDLLKFSRKHAQQASIEEDAAAAADKEMELDQQVFVGLGDEEGFPFEGRADYADLAVDDSTGTFLIRAVIPNPNRLIPPGAFIRVRVPQAEIDAILVDQRAIGRDQVGAYLLIVNGENKVERRNVKLGDVYDGLQAVTGQIGPDDRVIVRGIQRARPGSVVVPEELNSNEPKTDEAPASTPSEESK